MRVDSAGKKGSQPGPFVDPPREQWKDFRTQFTPGERDVANILAIGLEAPWRVYVQPHMNGLRPDFALVHPERGVLILEVKDWRSGTRDSLALEYALRKVEYYRTEAQGLYCPSLRGDLDQAVASWLCLPYFGRDALDSTLEKAGLNPRTRILTEDEVNRGLPDEIHRLLPAQAAMPESLLRDLGMWLLEPDFSSEQREPLEVSVRQRKLIESRTESGYRRVRGAAGSGKSLVLAARAAELARQGKEVLVVTFNVTLLNYLRDLAVRWPSPKEPSRPLREQVTWIHFHGWCRRVCLMSQRADDYRNLSGPRDGEDDSYFNRAIPNLALEVMREGSEESARYDAVLVDEGQDFLPDWWKALRFAVREGGEMLLASDATQDIYSRASTWTDEAMVGAGFSGPWLELPTSYRMPRDVVEVARRFAHSFLPERTSTLPVSDQLELNVSPVAIRWVDAPRGCNVVDVCVEELLAQLEELERLGFPELVFLTSQKKMGLNVVKRLRGRGIKVIHTFDGGRGSKQAFFKGDARVKATTIHSFKGWESRAILLHLGPRWNLEARAAAYAGLTRVKRSTSGSILTVVSEVPQLETFGRRLRESRIGE